MSPTRNGWFQPAGSNSNAVNGEATHRKIRNVGIAIVNHPLITINGWYNNHQKWVVHYCYTTLPAIGILVSHVPTENGDFLSGFHQQEMVVPASRIQ